jgi:hypothetical protein
MEIHARYEGAGALPDSEKSDEKDERYKAKHDKLLKTSTL